MTTNVYIDGFNLYYGSLRETPYKWLDIDAMCRHLLPDRDINRIRYFTARIKPFPHDMDAPNRQGIYIRALQTIPNMTIHYGHFSKHVVKYPKHPLTYNAPSAPPDTVQVIKVEEKRSDVNLATMLLVDCIDGDFEEAVVVSNDSDLTLPIEYTTGKFNKATGVINPQRRSKISPELSNAATWHYRAINRSVLAQSQFPATLSDDRGEFRKPALW